MRAFRTAPLPCRVAGVGVALAAVLALAGPARAQRLSPVTGEALMKLCTSKTPVGCDAYVSGVSDEAELLGRSNAEPTDSNAMQFCIPADVKGTALRQTVVAWAQAHSEDSKLPAAMLVVHAFRASFPCKGGTPAGSAGVR
ncbi:MAG: Rap1a/Tai family immunity protein [Janthinobacterium lividum]